MKRKRTTKHSRNNMGNFNKIIKNLIPAAILTIGFLFPLATFGQNGSLFFYPSSESFEIGQVFSTDLNLDTSGSFINAAEIRFYFPADKLEVVSIRKEGSVFSLWPEEPSFSNQSGEISLTGGLPHPGFKGTGKIISVSFRVKGEGEAIICFNESKVLADDGLGTNILVFISSPKYFLYQPDEKTGTDILASMFSSTHPKQDEWYNNNSPSFEWEAGEESSFVLDQEPETLPDTISEGTMGSKKYQELGDGTWYFHLRIKKAGQWNGVGHYKVNIDTSPPDPFQIIVDNKGDSTNPSPSLYFETQDQVSGIDKYRVKIGDSDFSDLLVAQIAPKLSPGSHKVIVRAVDKAYNVVRAKTTINIDPIETPSITVVPEQYLAGEEILYMEGTSLPSVEIMVYLKSGDRDIMQWKTRSNEKGEWSLSTSDLIKPGDYLLSAMAQDERGAISNLSQEYKLNVSFNGLIAGDIMVTSKNIILALSSLSLLGIIFAFWRFYKARMTRRILRKEIKEAKDSLLANFSGLEKEIEKKIGLVDSQPGLSEQERMAYEKIKESLKAAQQSIDKEIKDIEKELK